MQPVNLNSISDVTSRTTYVFKTVTFEFIFFSQCLSRSTAVEIVNSSKVLQAETRMLLDGKLLVRLSRSSLSSLRSLFPSLFAFGHSDIPSHISASAVQHVCSVCVRCSFKEISQFNAVSLCADEQIK